ncbi:transcription factor 25-like [Tropilaelaps mercedesae]|uniref:Transcription factor 25-like n=1 Tax=Tropilaelaps mercedesae TaxID=418985 RepID=A0A1V9XWB9_9ACAR|nr:transcription factor 25-like [Tropilaelaps mercedesae]
MSNRHLKRLEQQSDIKGIAIPVLDQELVNEENLAVTPKKKSIFQLLASASDGEEDEVDGVDGVDAASCPATDANGGGSVGTAQPGESVGSVIAGGGKGKNRKKARKKNKHRSGDADGKKGAGRSATDNESELERELRYIEGENQPAMSSSADIADQAIKFVLSFHPKYLNPERELRQKFGASVLREERHQQQGLLARFPGKRLPPGVTRGVLIPDAEQHFLEMHGRKIGGITMEPVADRVGYFEYKFSPDYWRTQAEFMLLFNVFNQDDIIGMHQRIGDHVDTLLQVATIFRMNEEKTRAAYFVEQAVFVLERAFHSAFDLHSGNCRLDYRAKPNRGLFIALFQHAYYLSERGCPRTALEVCKVLLSLDPESDPLAVLLVIDHYALRALEDEWLVQFFEAFQQAGRNLDQLVNFAYSIALANFRLKRFEEADQLLRKALISFPQGLKAITDKNSIMMDKKTASVFDKIYPEDPTVRLYAERCAWMYREHEVMRWLERVTAEIVDSDVRPVAVGGPFALLRNVLRHIAQSHVPTVTIAARYLPVDAQPLYEFDPFPPKDAYGDLSAELLPVTADDMLSNFTFANFLNSFVPAWTGQEDGQEENNAANLVRECISDIVGAVRNLMSVAGTSSANGDTPNNNNNSSSNNNTSNDDGDANNAGAVGAEAQGDASIQGLSRSNDEDRATGRDPDSNEGQTPRRDEPFQR